MKEILRSIVCLALIGACFPLYAKNYCQAMPQPKKEADTWYVPESAFTKKAANKALDDLKAQVNSKSVHRDFAVHNQLIMVKGYLYKKYLAAFEREFGKEDTALKREFCKFIQTQAYISH